VLHLPWNPKLFSIGPRLWPSLASSDGLPSAAQSLFGVFMFLLLSASLFYFARKKLD
jgi:hypothetical protein